MRTYLIALLLLSSVSVAAQFGKNVERHQFKVNLLLPGLEYEMALGQNSTIDLKAGLQYGLSPLDFSDYSTLELFGAYTTQYRYYHNLENRFRKNRMAYGNAGNYIALSGTLFTQSPIKNTLETTSFGTVGPVYGIQRGFFGGLSGSIEVGVGYYFGNFSGGVYPTFNFGLGWILGEKRWCVGK